MATYKSKYTGEQHDAAVAASLAGGGGSNVTIDTTMSVSGAAADAASVGQRFALMSTQINSKQPAGKYVKTVNGTEPDDDGNVTIGAGAGSSDAGYAELNNRTTNLEGSVVNIREDVATLQKEVDELEATIVEYLFKLVMRVIQLERAAGLQPPVTADGASMETEIDSSYDEMFGQT